MLVGFKLTATIYCIEFMDFIITILGLVAGALTTSASLPQMIKIWQSKSAQDVSLTMFIVLNIGVFLWLIYGLYYEFFPIIISNVLTLIINLTVVGLKIRYK